MPRGGAVACEQILSVGAPGGRRLALPLALSRAQCLEQILQAFCDIADRDDIHQAAARLARVQQWIEDEAERAAADPILADLQPV